MEFDTAHGEDSNMPFQDAENEFLTTVAPPGSGHDGKSLRTHFAPMFDAAQYAQMPSTIDPRILQQGNYFINPAEEDILPSLGVCVSSHSSTLRGTESQPRQELLPHGQSNHDDEQPLKRSKLHSSRRRIDEDEWVTKKQIIENLLLQEKKTLKEMMTIMEDEHQFKASKTSYKDHLKQWDLGKNLPKGLATYLWSKAKQRKDERGVGTQYWYRGSQVPINKYNRAGTKNSEVLPIRVRKSILSNLTILTTSTCSSDGFSEQLEPKRRRLDGIDDEVGNIQADQALQNPKSVILHQRTSRFPKGRDVNAVNGQQDSMSIEQRLDEHSFRQTGLFDELGLMSLSDLCNLADRLISRGLHPSNDLVLEALLTKLPGADIADAGRPESFFRYTESWLRTMVFQRKFLAARKILEGLRADNNFESFPPIHRLQIHKLALLVDVHENIHQPQNIESVEARCIALLAAQNTIGFMPDRYWPNNLILAYLFRLYGLFNRELQQDTIDRMDEVVRIQLLTKEPSISSVWAAQQYARWCLRRIELEKADNTLKSLKGVVGKNSAEDTQNAMLETVCKKMRPRKNQEPGAPQIVDIYERSKVDEQWQKCFQEYLWDEPYSYIEDPRMRSRKEQDAGYLH